MKKTFKNIAGNSPIIGVYLFLFLLLGFAGIEGINRQRRINKSYSYIIDSTIHKIRLLRQTRINAEQIQTTAIDEIFHIVPRSNDDVLQLDQGLLRNDSIFHELETEIENENERRLFNEMKIAWQTHKQSLDSFTRLTRDENAALAYYRRMEKNNWDNFYTTFNRFADFLYDTIKVKDEKIDYYVFLSQNLINFLIAVAALLLIILGVLVVKSVKNISRHNEILIEKDKILSESKNLYKELFDKSPLPKWVCDRKTLQFYEVNDAAIRLYGYSREEFLSLSVFDLLDEDDHQEAREFIRSNDIKESTRAIRKHIKKNGESFRAEIILNEIIYKGNKQILVAINDITAKLMAEETIRRSDELYRSLFNNSPAFIWVSEIPSLKYLDVNETAISQFGYSKEEFLSLTAFDLLHQEDVKKVKEQVSNLSDVITGLDRHVKKNGEVIYLEIRVHIINYYGKQAGLVIGIDVTEKLKVEEEIRKSETRFRTLIENSHDGISLLDADGKLIYLTPSVQCILGYSHDELMGIDPGKFIHPEDAPMRSLLIQQLSTCFGETRHAEYRIKHKNGQWHWLSSNITNMLHEPGIKALVLNYEDITERKMAEEKLRQEEEFFRTVMENSSDIQFATNKKREIIYASPSVYKNFGFQRDEIIGKTSKDFWHPDDIKATMGKIAELVSTPGKTIQVEVRVLDKKKNYRWCEARISNQLHNPAINGYVSNYSEITERKLAQEEVKNSEELYRFLFTSSPIPAWIADKTTLQFFEINNAAVEKYGYSRKEFLSMTGWDIRPEEEKQALRDFLELDLDKQSGAFSRLHLKKNGETLYAETYARTLHYKGKEAFLVMVNDVTERAQLTNQLIQEKVNQQREKTKAMIIGQEKERNELGKELHDNVNQILASAKIYLEASLAKDGEQMPLVEKGRNLVSLGIQEIRKISKSLVPPSLGNLTFREALRELVQTIKLAKKNVRLKTKWLDEEKLNNDLKVSAYRIVQEQLNNIIKYAEASEICIIINQTESELELKIADNGKGFDTTKKRNGIGITNMINRATIFNGKVIIDSSPGNGCRVNAIFKLSEIGKNLELPFYHDDKEDHLKPIS